MTIGKAAKWRPSVGVEAVDIVERVHLPDDGRNIVVHVAGKHAGLEEPWIFTTELHGAVRMAHGPFRMGLEGVTPVEVRAHPSDATHAALLRGSNTFAKKIAAIQELALPVKFHL